ncbi:MAG: hypothetical protein QOG50_3160, partial [Actinomycetota bacterium]|nr:hypothetical protein [Actinomycetota bacterium]
MTCALDRTRSTRRYRGTIATALAVALVGAIAFTASAVVSSTNHNAGAVPETESPAAAHYSRAVCAEHPGRARCDSEVQTDASGRPLVFKRPTKNPSAAYGTWNSYGISPAAFHKAYNLPRYSGVRQTIAVVDAYDHPNEKADLDSYDSAWGLGSFPNCSSTQTTACFQRVDQNGNAQGFANNDAVAAAGWTLETNLDVQLAHGICQNCKILLVEAYADSPANLAAAVNTAARL